MSSCANKKGCCWKTLVVLGVLVVLAVAAGIIGKSFITMEYYEYGFKRHITKGTIDRTKVYGAGGYYFLGPSFNFATMRADAQFIEFDGVMIFAKDRLEVEISAQMQYFLRKDQMHLLHKKYDVDFGPIIYTNALSAMKNKAPTFETREYLRNRTLVERELFLAIREAISGPCCEDDCDVYDTCIPGCRRKDQCTENDYGFFVDVRYFQLAALDLPSGLKDKFLRTQVLYEEANIELYRQNASIIRKETDSSVKQIRNQANEIRKMASASSSLLKSKASANATAQVEHARTAGLQYLFETISITDPKQKASFEYLRTLAKQGQVRLAVNFNELIAGKL